MDSHELNHLLTAVAAGELSVADATLRIRTQPYVDAGGFAKVDLHRRVRCGFPEVIFGQGKTAAQIEAILRTLIEQRAGGAGDAGRARGRGPSPGGLPRGRAQRARPHVPDRRARRERDPRSGGSSSSRRGRATCPSPRRRGSRPRPGIARSRSWPTWASRGSTGSCTSCPRLGNADALVVVAGMEGALPSVVGGLVDCPVIAVPTSIGYGAHFQGLAALLGMLNSCASNVVVVNIDAGLQRRARRRPDRAAGRVSPACRRASRGRSPPPTRPGAAGTAILPAEPDERPRSRSLDLNRLRASIPWPSSGSNRSLRCLRVPPTATRGFTARSSSSPAAAGWRARRPSCGASALRSGAGLVRVASPAEVQPTVASFEPSLHDLSPARTTARG